MPDQNNRTTRPVRSTHLTTKPAPAASAQPGGTSASEQPSGRRKARQRESAFSTLFLERARRREAEPELAESPVALRARFAGSWDVEEVPAGRSRHHAVVRSAEPAREGGGAKLACGSRQEALFGAATLAALAAPNRLSVNRDKPSGRRSPLGHPFHDGSVHLGHLSPSMAGAEEEFLAYFHAIRSLAASPEAIALFLEALDGETLALLGRAAMRRMG